MNKKVILILLLLFVLALARTFTGCNAKHTDTPPSDQVATITPIPHYGDTIATVTINEVRSYSDEQIVRSLVSKWLESYKTWMNTMSTDEITDYKTEMETRDIDAITDYIIGDITVRNYSGEYDIVAAVIFSVVTVGHSSLWSSLGTSVSDPNDVWDYCGTTFGVLHEGVYFKLILLPGWGT